VPVVIAGYGLTGTGVTGATSGFGTLRVGTNEYINTGQLVGYAPDMLVGQFYESGVSGTNALGVAIPYTSSDEVDIASGDSGGPTFYDGQIVGVHDVSGCLGSGCSLNSVFGDTFGDTATDEAMSMSTSETNATWIEDQEVGQAPEPASSALLGLGLVFLAAQRFRSAPSRRRLAGK
jgi:hypothetical protein